MRILFNGIIICKSPAELIETTCRVDGSTGEGGITGTIHIRQPVRYVMQEKSAVNKHVYIHTVRPRSPEQLGTH